MKTADIKCEMIFQDNYEIYQDIIRIECLKCFSVAFKHKTLAGYIFRGITT